jgi:uncharacterized protein
MRKSTSKIIAASGPSGNIEAVRQLAREACDAGAGVIALAGSLTPKNGDPREYAEVLKALSEAQLPAFYIPGPEDAPFSEFLREAANFEVVYPNVRGIHGTFGIAPGHVVWSGMGGTIEDHPDTIRNEVSALCYPGWEVEYRLKFLQELKEYQKVFMFTTFPEHKGRREKGSAVLAEIIKTYNPRLVLVGGGEPGHEIVGKSLLVALGCLAEGNFTVIDFRKREVTPRTLREPAKAA